MWGGIVWPKGLTKSIPPTFRLLSTVVDGRIDMKLLMALRTESGMSMRICRQALMESGNDLTVARANLSKLAGLNVENKLNLNMWDLQEGSVGIYNGPQNQLCIIKIKCKTDFVARNSHFSELASKLSSTFFQKSFDTETIVQNTVKEAVSILQEPIVVESKELFERGFGTTLGTYLHNRAGNNMGTIGVVVEISFGKTLQQQSEADEFANKLARHVAGLNPASVAELLEQDFLFSSEGLRVRELLKNYPEAQIIKFVRMSIK